LQIDFSEFGIPEQIPVGIWKMSQILTFDKFFQNADDLQSVEEIGKYLQKLDNTFSELSIENIKLIDGLFWLLLSLWKKLDEIEKQGRLSEKTKKLAKSIEDAVNDLLEKLRKNKNFDLKNDSSLQYDLDEAVIGLAIQRLGEVLWAGATPILVGVNKYRHNNELKDSQWGLQEMSELSGTLNDVQAVWTKLTQFYKSKSPISLLDEGATKENILSTIRSSPKDKPIFFYFSWHGMDWHLVPFIPKQNSALSREEQLKKSISPEELYNAIWSRKAVVIVDKCLWWLLVSKAPKNIQVISASDEHHSAEEKSMYELWLQSRQKKLWNSINTHTETEVTIDGLQQYRAVFSYFLTKDSWGFNFRSALDQTRATQNPQFWISK
jgi:hypothetical protein